MSHRLGPGGKVCDAITAHGGTSLFKPHHAGAVPSDEMRGQPWDAGQACRQQELQHPCMQALLLDEGAPCDGSSTGAGSCKHRGMHQKP